MHEDEILIISDKAFTVGPN